MGAGGSIMGAALHAPKAKRWSIIGRYLWQLTVGRRPPGRGGAAFQDLRRRPPPDRAAQPSCTRRLSKRSPVRIP